MSSLEFGASTSSLGPCAVCGVDDARKLTQTRLSTGELATVCGSHELMYRRHVRTAATAQELRELLSDRREREERRGRVPADELVSLLSESFSTERRTGADRRRA